MALNNPYALGFDGVDDRALGPQLSTYNTGTVECVIRVQHEHIGAFVGTYSTTTGGSNRQLALAVYPYTQDRFRIHISASTHDALLFTAVTVSGFTYGEPHHVAYTSQHGSGKVDLIVDGIIQDITTELGTMTDCFFGRVMQPSDRLQIGAKRDISGVHSRPFRGIVDEFRLWNYVRTLEQIQTNAHRRLTGSETGLVVYYRFDEGTGGVAYDSSPNGYHGEITGATWVPGLVDLEGLAPPGRVDISAVLGGSASMSVGKADRIRGVSAHLTGAATSTGGTPICIRRLAANLVGAGTTNVRMNLIAALKARLQGKATLKSNMLVLFVPEGVYVIDADEIFAKDQPSRGQVVANHIEVWVNPLKPADTPEEVYRSKDPVTIPAGKTETVTIQFDDEPVTESAVVLEEAGVNLSIIDTKYYAWGADVTIQNTGAAEQTCIIVATGKPLKVQGREVIVKRDEVSIQENGLKKYTFDNPFVQDRATAEMIAERLLSYANARRDISIEWRGDPALQLADIVMIPEYQRRGLDQRGIFYITKQELEFDGGLRAKLEGRKM